MDLRARIALWFVRRKVRRAARVALGRKLTRKEIRMFSSIFTSWRTTAAGAVMAVLQMVAGGMTWKAALAALPTLLLGALAKDSQVTGGTKAATDEATVRVIR